jgi:hypothetical protein
VFLLIWLKLIFSDSEVAGNNATGHVTKDSRKKPFQLARGAMYSNSNLWTAEIQDEEGSIVPTVRPVKWSTRGFRVVLSMFACSFDVDVRCAPKPKRLLQSSEMTRRANKRH